MKTRILLVILLILIAHIRHASAQEKQFRKALDAYGRHSFVAARTHLEKIEKPDVASRILLAKVLYQLSDYAQIEMVLSGLDHLDRDARLALATSYHMTEQYEKARVSWKNLLSGDDQAIIYSNIGDTFYNTGEIDSSIFYIGKAIAADPLSDLYVLNLGIAYSAVDESGRACAHFFLAAMRNNNDAASMYERENCISWQHHWLQHVPGTHVAATSNTFFPELHRDFISANENYMLREYGEESRVTLSDITRTDVGVVFTFRNQQQELLHRWVTSNQKPSFVLRAAGDTRIAKVENK